MREYSIVKYKRDTNVITVVSSRVEHTYREDT